MLVVELRCGPFELSMFVFKYGEFVSIVLANVLKNGKKIGIGDLL